MPGLWIVAGPNGAGKTTLVSRRLAHYLPVVNPDDIAFDLPRVGGQLDQRRAGEIAIERRRALLDSGKTFAIETTLTGSSALRLLRSAKAMGFRINLAFVGLSNVELSGARVLDRVAKGGHAVPNSDLMRRFPASLLNLGIAAKLADRTFLFDNSGRQRRLLLIRTAGRNRFLADELPRCAQEALGDLLNT